MITRRTRNIRDRLLTWIARRCLRFMSNRAAWNLYMTMGFAYSVEPHLAREGED